MKPCFLVRWISSCNIPWTVWPWLRDSLRTPRRAGASSELIAMGEAIPPEEKGPFSFEDPLYKVASWMDRVPFKGDFVSSIFTKSLARRPGSFDLDDMAMAVKQTTPLMPSMIGVTVDFNWLDLGFRYTHEIGHVWPKKSVNEFPVAT